MYSVLEELLLAAYSSDCHSNISFKAMYFILRPPLWSSGKSFCYRSRGFGFDSRPWQIFSEAVGLERGPLSLMRIIEELLE
jgi:hypothetical protein